MQDTGMPGSTTDAMTDAELLKQVRRIIKTPEQWPTTSIYPSEKLAMAIITFFTGRDLSS